MLWIWMSSAAMAYESDPQEIELYDFAELFTAGLDTGWVPSSGPLGVRFYVDADGGADAYLDGDAHLRWPEDLNLSFEPQAGTGLIDINSVVAAVVEIRFDIDIWSSEFEIGRESVDLVGAETFDPFVMVGSVPEVVTVIARGDEEVLFRYSQALFGVVDVGFQADLQPVGEVNFEGVSWLVEDQRIDEAGEAAVLAPEGLASLNTDATFVAAWDSVLDLVLTPTFFVDTPIGGFDFDIFQLPLNLSTERFEQAFSSVPLRFPLPLLSVDGNAHDFGAIEVGNLSNYQLALSNLGELPSEGVLSIVGSEDFTVFPEYFLAAQDTTDGVVVTYSPSDSGVAEAMLVIESNDPNTPRVEILLSGEGFVEGAASGANGDGDSGVDREGQLVTSGCGCSAGPRGGGWSALLFLAGVLGVAGRRRRGAI
ncbi:MAG: MYXO-CTERM sorting domain-containing protein [Myxococcota bacterium]